ncbi:hypothetical protein [Kutzneria kofuensis]|uniref:hypothetical protein n=1 Tax=Kutzneria kofuensis TaxID=103725 RepID=UPI0031EA73D0
MRLSQLVGPRTSKVVERPDPVPAADQVLVEVLACGVCTSDLSAWRKPRSGLERDAPRPRDRRSRRGGRG